MWLMKRGDELCFSERVALRKGEKNVSATTCLGQKVMEDSFFIPSFRLTFFILKKKMKVGL
jgi:hypothetical protein